MNDSFLNKLSKKTLIAWVKENCWMISSLKEHYFLFLEWEVGTKKLEEDNKDFLKRRKILIEKGMEYDKFVKEFLNDPNKRIEIFNKGEEYTTLSKKFRKEQKILDERQKKFDKLYKKIEILRKNNQ